MAFVAAAIAGGGALLGGLVSSSGASSAANAEAGAANNANNINQQEFNTIQAENAPYRAAGTQALAEMQNPAFQQGFTLADFHEQPGYQFALQQGNNALQASQAAQGNNISGAGLAALDTYNQGMANQQYQQAFQNFNQTQNQNYSRLSTLANLGAGGNAQSNSAGQNFANQSGANSMAAGSAGAQGIAGQTNALTGAISGVSGAIGQAMAPAPSGSGYSTMSQFGSAPASNLQAPSFAAPSAGVPAYTL